MALDGVEPEGHGRPRRTGDSAGRGRPRDAAAPSGTAGVDAADRSLRYRLRKSRERRRRQLPLEEDLTTIYVADTADAIPVATRGERAGE